MPVLVVVVMVVRVWVVVVDADHVDVRMAVHHGAVAVLVGMGLRRRVHPGHCIGHRRRSHPRNPATAL